MWELFRLNLNPRAIQAAKERRIMWGRSMVPQNTGPADRAHPAQIQGSRKPPGLAHREKPSGRKVREVGVAAFHRVHGEKGSSWALLWAKPLPFFSNSFFFFLRKFPIRIKCAKIFKDPRRTHSLRGFTNCWYFAQFTLSFSPSRLLSLNSFFE